MPLKSPCVCTKYLECDVRYKKIKVSSILKSKKDPKSFIGSIKNNECSTSQLRAI